MTEPELPSRVVAGISFAGRGGGRVKSLGGFRKGRHTEPETANATTEAFLVRLCAGELAAEAERYFQEIRSSLGYRRRELALEILGATALLTAPDFELEIAYTLDPADPARYAVTTTLRNLRAAALARTPEFERVFAGRFAEISFALKKNVRVEDVIDVIEATDRAPGLKVEYPSDCRQCLIRVSGVDAEVRCSPAALEMVFPRPGSPAGLMDGFMAVRHAFAISKVLSGLVS